MMSFTQFAQEKDAASFRTAFQDAIQSAIADELEQQKFAIAQSMFGGEDQLQEEMSDEELDEYLDSLSDEELEALAEEAEQLAESDWENRHNEFVSVGNNASSKHISSIKDGLKTLADKASKKKGIVNKIVGNRTNGQLATISHSATSLHKHISRNQHAEHGTEARKELGQHLSYAAELLHKHKDLHEEADQIDEVSKKTYRVKHDHPTNPDRYSVTDIKASDIKAARKLAKSKFKKVASVDRWDSSRVNEEVEQKLKTDMTAWTTAEP
jgi:hypothetical protein